MEHAISHMELVPMAYEILKFHVSLWLLAIQWAKQEPQSIIFYRYLTNSLENGCCLFWWLSTLNCANYIMKTEIETQDITKTNNMCILFFIFLPIITIENKSNVMYHFNEGKMVSWNTKWLLILIWNQNLKITTITTSGVTLVVKGTYLY
jgi:hypothetical protein